MTKPRSRRTRPLQPKGFSLIEVLIVVLFIAGALLALTRLQGSLISGSNLSQQRAQASFLARRLMEDLKSNPYDSASLSAGSYTRAAETRGSATFTPTYSVANSTGPERKTITVTVSWTDAGGVSQSATLMTQYQQSQAKAAGNSLLIADTTSNNSSSSPCNLSVTISRTNDNNQFCDSPSPAVTGAACSLSNGSKSITCTQSVPLNSTVQLTLSSLTAQAKGTGNNCVALTSMTCPSGIPATCSSAGATLYGSCTVSP